MIGIRVEGEEELERSFAKAGDQVNLEIVQAVNQALIILEQYAKLITGRPGGGRLYPRPGGTHHRASVPGAPPARDSGQLTTGISSQVSQGLEGVQGIIGTNEEYGPYLEYGTARMEPRPFMIKTLVDKQDEVIKSLERVLDKVSLTIEKG